MLSSAWAKTKNLALCRNLWIDYFPLFWLTFEKLTADLIPDWKAMLSESHLWFFHSYYLVNPECYITQTGKNNRFNLLTERHNSLIGIVVKSNNRALKWWARWQKLSIIDENIIDSNNNFEVVIFQHQQRKKSFNMDFKHWFLTRQLFVLDKKIWMDLCNTLFIFQI